MATDPYHVVQQEIQASLHTASTLRASYRRIRSTAREESEELAWARNELKATLSALAADLEDLEESVKIVEETGARLFGLDDAEVAERRRYVSHVRQEISDIRADVEPAPSSSASGVPRASARSPASPGAASPADDDHQAQWAAEEQVMIMQRQDQAIDSISGTLSTLAQQAGLIGQEVVEHNELLDDLEVGVDHTEGKLDSAMKRMRKFIRQTEETKSGWCIAILIVILLILLLAVILV